MIIGVIVLSIIAIIIILFYDKKGSIKEMERYYKTQDELSKEEAFSKKQTKDKKFNDLF